ncbi:hypothetical protein [Pseudonocardia acaciae]|uniref:hypothetical protein n=1 Tax=Pseudonocardia acaciae TaxID=551276 RepID=UPI00068517CC|nr:hypothetical protein [Pseudonocardia acaciae]
MPSIDAFEPADRHGSADPTAVRRRRGPGRGGRLGPRAYRVLRAAHIVVSGGWLGVGIGKLVLELGAVTAGSARRAEALFMAATAISKVFPPMIMATLLTGVVLCLGTRWGLLRYYWVVTKLGLTLAVVVTALSLLDGLAWQALPIHPVGADAVAGGPVGLLTSLSGVYTATLLVATVVSVYKPWGRISWRRRSRSL